MLINIIMCSLAMRFERVKRKSFTLRKGLNEIDMMQRDLEFVARCVDNLLRGLYEMIFYKRGMYSSRLDTKISKQSASDIHLIPTKIRLESCIQEIDEEVPIHNC